jgi:hypothetical protein
MISIVPSCFKVANVDVKTTGVVTLIPAMAKKLLLLDVISQLVSISGDGSNSRVASMGVTASSYNDIVDGTSFGGRVAQSSAYPESLMQEAEYIVPRTADLTTNGLRLNIISASSWTTHVVDFYVIGILL